MEMMARRNGNTQCFHNSWIPLQRVGGVKWKCLLRQQCKRGMDVLGPKVQGEVHIFGRKHGVEVKSTQKKGEIGQGQFALEFGARYTYFTPSPETRRFSTV